MVKVIKARVMRNIGTESSWLSKDPVLMDGEVAYVRFGTKVRQKVGNGAAKFSVLEYQDSALNILPIDTTFNFTTAPEGLYMPKVNGIYNGVTVDLDSKIVFLFWNGSGLEKVEVPIDLVDYLSKDRIKPSGLRFTSGYVEIPTTTSLFPDNSWTIEFYLKTRSIHLPTMILNSGMGTPGVIYNDGKLFISKNGEFNVGWIHANDQLDRDSYVTITYDGTLKVKLDNLPKEVFGFAPADFDKSAQKILVGSYDGSIMNADMDMYLLRVYNRALSDSELTTNYNGGFPHLINSIKDESLMLELLGDNATPTTWVDSSPKNLKGKLKNDVVSFSRKTEADDGFEFNDSGFIFNEGAVQIADIALFPSPAWTLQIFFRPEDIQSPQTLMENGEGNPLILIHEGDIILNKRGELNTIRFNAAPFLENFNFLSISYDGANYKVYLNDSSLPFTIVNNLAYAKTSAPFSLGAFEGRLQFFKGSIHLARFYNRALSSEEIKESYNKGNPLMYKSAKEAFLILELLGDNATPNSWLDSSIYNHSSQVEGSLVSKSNHSSGISKELDQGFLSVVPSKINVAVDREFNLWFDSVIPHYGKEFRINVNCSKGESRERSFRYKSSTIEDVTMTVTVKDLSNNVVETRTIRLECVSKSKGTGTKQLLFIGDSNFDSFNTSDYPIVPEGRERYETIKEINNLFVTDGGFAPKFLGNRGEAPYHHQAHSGYTTDLFLTNNPTYPNPFWDGSKVNFKNYMSVNSNFGAADRIDVAVIQLSINDFRYGGSVTAVFNNIKALASKIQDPVTGYPDCRVLISMSPYTAITRDGWALHFKAISDYDGFVSRMLELDKLLIKEENPANLFFVCPTMLWVDRMYGYPRELTKVSDRATEEEYEYTDSVHPSISGYKQAADALYSKLRGIL